MRWGLSETVPVAPARFYGSRAASVHSEQKPTTTDTLNAFTTNANLLWSTPAAMLNASGKGFGVSGQADIT